VKSEQEIRPVADYKNPEKWGRESYHAGIEQLDCPISGRTNANAKCLWVEGWIKAYNNRCKGEQCKADNGIGHSKECEDEHDRAVNG